MPNILFEVEALNGGSQFSQEDKWIIWIDLAMLFFVWFTLGRTIKNLASEFKQEETLENPLIVLMVGVVAEMCMVLCDSVNMLSIYLDGNAHWIMKGGVIVWRTSSEFMIICLLLFIASGWTITHKSLLDRENFVIMAGLIFFADCIGSTLNLYDHGEHHKFHDYSGWPGAFLVILRVVLFIVFMF